MAGNGRKNKKEERIGKENFNNQGCLMKCIEYNGVNDVVIEFQDEYRFIARTQWKHFENGNIKNPYYSEVLNIGKIGAKYPSKKDNKHLKEYIVWRHMLERCFDLNYKNKYPSYKHVTCCDEWLLYENFYEWLHKQPNFNKWLNGNRWAVDKDILYKGNKLYSPETCLLVPQNINSLFTKRNLCRGNLPIGVQEHSNKYRAYLSVFGKHINFPVRESIDEAFSDYKKHKENMIKHIAKTEFDNGNITKECFDAMVAYEVEITD